MRFQCFYCRVVQATRPPLRLLFCAAPPPRAVAGTLLRVPLLALPRHEPPTSACCLQPRSPPPQNPAPARCLQPRSPPLLRPWAGLAKLGCDSLDKLKAKLPALRAEVDDPDKYRQIYNYAYLFSRWAGRGVLGC